MSGATIRGFESGMQRARRCPVVVGTAVLAVAISLQWWSGHGLGELLSGPVRLITSVFPHGSVLHLVFNLWWLFVFGTEVETVLGSRSALVLFAALAVGSSAWQEALATGGVGLSGVGYGLFGFLWVLSRTDRRFRGVIDRETVRLFVGWFFLCCFLTSMGIWNVGNVAHGAGGILGAILGAAVSKDTRFRVAMGIAAVVLVSVGIVGFVHPMPQIWMGAPRVIVIERQAYEALAAGRNEEAADLYGEVIAIDPTRSDWFHNRGIACHRLERWEEALADYREAARLNPEDTTAREAAAEIDNWLQSMGK